MSKQSPGKKSNRPALIFLAIMVLAILIRVVWLARLASSEMGGELSIDAEFYRTLASGIIHGQGLPAGALTFNPLYPFFLVGVFKLFGDSLAATRLLQAVIGLGVVVLVYVAGRMLVETPRKGRLSQTTVSLIAMAMAVLYTQFALYEGMLLGTSLEVFILIASFTLCLALDEDLHGHRTLRIGRWRVPVWLSAAATGALCGAGALGRPNLFLLLVAGIPVWIIGRNLQKRRWLAPVLGFAAGVALFLLPPIIYNAKNAGEFVPVTAHGGINFYIGNRIGTEGVYQPPEGMRGERQGLLEDALALAEKETGRTLTDAEASDYYMQKALDGIKQDPGGWLILLGRKFVLFWNKIEVHDLPEVVYFQDSMRLFKFPFLQFALIAPLGLAGLVVFMRGGRNRSIVALYLGVALLSILLFYLNARYRLPIVPVVILLAAYFIAWVWQELAQKRKTSAWIMIGVAAATFFLVSNRTIVKANMGSVYTYLGTFYMNAGETKKAEEAFAKAYRMDPNRDTSLINYGRTLLLQEQFDQAAKVLAQAYAQNPRYPHLAGYLAMALQRSGRNDEARKLALDIVASGDNTDKVTAYKILATASFFDKDREAATKWVKAGLEIAPDDQELAKMLEAIEAMPAP
jgi:tetratricopeptide (TPR) repeat protein